MKITPVLLCGGSGTRLWPLSRKSYPKQFSSFSGERSLFQASAKRLSGRSFGQPLVVTADPFRFIVTEQMSAIGIEPEAVLIEPDGRDTAPAVLAAALYLRALDPKGLMLVAPSDHLIPDEEAFENAVQTGVSSAMAGQLITFGISPDRPETGYGYLKLEDALTDDMGVAPLEGFVEKPDRDRANAMLTDGRYLWNSGIFLFSAEAICTAFQSHAPEMVVAVADALEAAQMDLGFTRLGTEGWSKTQPISIDYAVMEKAENLAVVPYRGRWSDLGDWASVWRETEQDGLALSGQTTQIDCDNTLLRSETEGQTIVGIGLKDVVAVAMPDAVLISHKDRSQDVRQAVKLLRSKGEPQAEAFPKDHRPWGWFESLIVGDRFQVKRIVVHPGAALSLQSHHHRSEHWIVVQGTAKVTIQDEVKLISENESVYVPLGAKHRMENPGKMPMVLIEVQTGSYLGEDDIIRYEDHYSRG